MEEGMKHTEQERKEVENVASSAGLKEELSRKAGTIKEKEELSAKTGNVKETEGFSAKTKNVKETEGFSAKTKNVEEKEEFSAKTGTDTDAWRPIRLLRADEIECRVSTISEKGLSLLLFKDARVDQKILDETFTPFGWKRTHQSIDGNLYCTVEIWDPEKSQWIAKQDVGTVSYSEKEKGQASDSFKRACFNWGLGRELYTAPVLWVPAGSAAICREGERYVTSDRFHVQHIAYNPNREITELRIVNGRGQTVYELKQKMKQHSALSAYMEELKRELARTGVTMEAVLERYALKEPGEMTEEIYKKALRSLKKTRTKEAA